METAGPGSPRRKRRVTSLSSTYRERAGDHATAPTETRVWDPVVRYGHWTLVILFFVAYFSEREIMGLHAWSGYLVGGYVVLRVLWGLVGTRHARFIDFAYGPKKALLYLRDLLQFRAKRYVGHSPAGAAMVFMLLLSLVGTVVSGTALYAVRNDKGPLAPWLGQPTAAVSQLHDPGTPSLIASARAEENHQPAASGNTREEHHRRGGWLHDAHSFFANLTLILVFAHVAGVLLASFAHQENLIRAMWTGRKRPSLYR